MTIPHAAARLYGDLARWWPLISPVDVYEGDAGIATELFGLAEHPVRDVLELGSGGGHTAYHLRSRYAMTLVDLSPEMLAVSRELNPNVEHLPGDMRDVRLGRTFDAVLVHDAIDYMTTAQDLSAAFRTAFTHCRPGGVAVFFPDHVADTFEPVTDCGGSDANDGSGVRYLEWSLPPEPGATTVRTEYTFTLRESDGSIRTVHETHLTGLFPVADWERLLGAAGFRVSTVRESGGHDRTLFLGQRPA
ncbi:class I SAM-dependent methyltransferase [Streptomyces litchfieldiae]|uniref:Methyltransferase domain-containing protein n=1 Tax=Streptomyces litchfieldiae TaxID=3075543 RepID=A0ABU2MQE4_9ACTN|nr:methyltransferase domain-containing protein [Streptomyces sp. DSM 44938]MDT0343573.1 methyltransferase domain-containing protein [Streptomyces sp. DSM 44938]